MRTFVVYVLTAATLAVAAWFGFPALFGAEHQDAIASGETTGPPPVIVSPAARLPFAASLEALGDVRANESVVITPVLADHVAAIHFTDGEQVKAGQLLLEMTSDEEHAQLDEARAMRNDRRLTHERVAELHGKGIASERELDAANSALDAANARVAALEATIADREIRAPFDGTLGLRHVSVGAFVEPDTVITTLDDLSLVKLDFTIPETWLPDVQTGMHVVATSDAWKGDTFEGTVAVVDTRVDATTRSATVRAVLPNPDRKLRPGMLLKVRVQRGDAPALQIPEEALVPVGEKQYVYRIGEGDVAERVEVKIGRRRVGAVEVLDGIREGDRVVIEGVIRVRPGEPVAVVDQRPVRSESE